MKYLIVVAHPDDEVLEHPFISGLVMVIRLTYAL